MRFVEDSGQSAMLSPAAVPYCLLTSRSGSPSTGATSQQQQQNEEERTTFAALAEGIAEFIERFRCAYMCSIVEGFCELESRKTNKFFEKNNNIYAGILL
jgi:hypothetical protein